MGPDGEYYDDGGVEDDNDEYEYDDDDYTMMMMVVAIMAMMAASLPLMTMIVMPMAMLLLMAMILMAPPSHLSPNNSGAVGTTHRHDDVLAPQLPSRNWRCLRTPSWGHVRKPSLTCSTV